MDLINAVIASLLLKEIAVLTTPKEISVTTATERFRLLKKKAKKNKNWQNHHTNG